MAWGQYRTITIDKDKCGTEDTSNFSVFVGGTYSYLATVANGGKVENASGYDIAFYSDSALTTLLKFERVVWTATTGAVQFWVNIPTLSVSADTVIYMAYGNSAQSTDLQDAQNTWDSNFIAVHHFTETSGNILDSTGNNNDLTSIQVTDQSVTGPLPNGNAIQVVNTSGDYAKNTSPTGLPTGNTAAFLEAWGKATGDAGDGSLINFGTWAANQGHSLANRQAWVADYVHWGNELYGTLFLIDFTEWYYQAAGHNTTTQYLYNNGALDKSGSHTAFNNTGANIYYGNTSDGGHPLDGWISEGRISNILRTASYVAANWNNQNSPSTFYAVGDETSVGGAAAKRKMKMRAFSKFF